MPARWDTVEVDGDPMHIYVAMPEGPAPWPGVLVMQGQGGVEETIQTLTRRIADAGFVAAAPELYHRQKDNILEEVAHLPPGTPERSEKLRWKGQQLRDTELIADGRATIACLHGLPECDVRRLGIVGFCQGGRAAYLLATSISGFSAAVTFYSANLWNALGDGPSPFGRTANLACPLLGVFGQDDRNPSPEQMHALDGELNRLGKPHVFHSYEGTGHDFQNFRSSNYRQGPAEDSWGKMVGFLREHLAVPAGVR